MWRAALAAVMMLGLGTGCATRAARPPPPEVPAPRPQQRPPAPPESKAPQAYLGEGLASYYGPGLNGNRTASGERLNMHDFTAAHRTLPFGTCLRVVNMENGRSVEVRVNDRGPFKEGRIVDVSLAAAKKLGLVDKGLARVRLYRCERPVSAIPAPFQAGLG